MNNEERDMTIRRLVQLGHTCASVAERFGISRQRVEQVIEQEASSQDTFSRGKYNPDLVLSFILNFKSTHDGNSPSFRQITRECGISTISVTADILRRLKNAGKIQIVNGRIHVTGGHWEVLR